MTHDVDLLATRAAALAEDVRLRLAERIHIAVRVREIVQGQGFRVCQVRNPTNRHLVDVRQIETLPSVQRFGDVQVIAPAELVAMKVSRMVHRAGRPKAGTDLVDVQRRLLAFPVLKSEAGVVNDQLRHMGAQEAAFSRWREIVEAPHRTR